MTVRFAFSRIKRPLAPLLALGILLSARPAPADVAAFEAKLSALDASGVKAQTTWQSFAASPIATPFLAQLGVTAPAQVQSFIRVMRRTDLTPQALAVPGLTVEQRAELVKASADRYAASLIQRASAIESPSVSPAGPALSETLAEFSDVDMLVSLAPQRSAVLRSREAAVAAAGAALTNPIRQVKDAWNDKAGVPSAATPAESAGSSPSALQKSTPETKPARPAQAVEVLKFEGEPVLEPAIGGGSFRDLLPRFLRPGIRAGDVEAFGALRLADGGLDGLKAAKALARQDGIEAELRRQLLHVVEMNAPPAPWDKRAKPWNAFIEQLPNSVRYQFTLDLLKKQGTSAERAAALISGLEPTDEIRRAVADFLNDGSPFIERAVFDASTARRLGFVAPLYRVLKFAGRNPKAFSKEQVRAMFAGDRFHRFFPWTFDTDLARDAQADRSLIFAVRTKPGSTLKFSWLRDNMRRSWRSPDPARSLEKLLGFSPVFSPTDSLTSSSFSGSSNESQIRGVVVQGGYAKNGQSMFSRQTGRGDSQVESDAWSNVERLERVISGLPGDEALLKRLLAYNWALDAQNSLIGSLRTRAVKISALTRGLFYGLRVEVHNFPTVDLLRRVRDFKDSYRRILSPGGIARNLWGFMTFGGRKRVLAELDLLVAEMERFLWVRQEGAQLNAVIDEMPASSTSKKALHSLSADFENLPPQAKLPELLKLRAGWKESAPGKERSTWRSSPLRSSPLADYYLGDRALSQLAMATAADRIENLGPVADEKGLEEFAELGSQILAHVVADDFLSPRQQASYLTEIAGILKDPGLPIPKKEELILSLYGNAVDQAQHGLTEEFGKYDELLSRIRMGKGPTPPKYVDTLMRSANVFLLGKLVDRVTANRLASANLTQRIGSRDYSFGVQVFNPGATVGVLRIGKDPLALAADEIGVFEQMPEEAAPMAGIVTVGAGARLSHLNLLAKSLGIPNVMMDRQALDVLKAYDGKWVSLAARKDGTVEIQEVSASDAGKRIKNGVRIPQPDLSIDTPVTFKELGTLGYPRIAGPKGIELARMFNDPKLRANVPDGNMLPFGFFARYTKAAGIDGWLRLLSQTKIENTYMVSFIAGRIRDRIAATPLPKEMLEEAMVSARVLQRRTGAEGFFFRSDTHIEDLEDFNAAGLNESVPNVLLDDPAEVDRVIRRVWISPFSAKSIFWRALALPSETVTIAMPSVVVMPTVKAKSSGVILSQGAEGKGRGVLSANWGIGSVVQAGNPVEEIDLESGVPHRSAFTTTRRKPVAAAAGGLAFEPVEAGTPLLDGASVEKLNALAQKAGAVLGEKKLGWDIEWVEDQKGKIVLVQARPVVDGTH